MTETIRSPASSRHVQSALSEYPDWLETRTGRTFADHDALWAWSVEDLDRFWLLLSSSTTSVSTSPRRGPRYAPRIPCRLPGGTSVPG